MKRLHWSRGAACGSVLLWAGTMAVPAQDGAALPAAPPSALPGAVPVPVPAAAETVATLPLVVHCGKLLRVERVPGPLPWVDAERLLAEGNLDAGTGDKDAIVQREPAAGTCFAVVVFEVARDRSLSKYDYRLDAGGKAYECLGLGAGENAADSRRWKVATPGEVRMLFQVPADQTAVHLVPALTSSVPLRTVRDLAFGAPAAVPPAAVPPAAVPPAAVVPAAIAPAPAAPAAPAAAAVAKPAEAAAAKPAAPTVAAPAPPAAPAKPAPAKRDALEF